MEQSFHSDNELSHEFWSDFAQTLFAIPQTKLEIAYATKGGSKFNQAIYFESLSLDQLKYQSKIACNVSFLAGCSSKYLLSPLGEKTKRMATNQCIRHKNIIIFDLDFKDNISNYKDLEPEIKKKEVEDFIEIVQSKIKAEQLPLWIMNFSGNGLHFYFKLKSPIETSNYKSIYQGLLNYLEASLGVTLDVSCSNAARLIRLPGSINWKDVSNPVPCRVLYFAPEIFCDQLLLTFAKTITVDSSRKFKERDHIESKLSLLKILKFFNYKKPDSIIETKEKIICSSPLTNDVTPSFHFDKEKRFFYCFSSTKGGDLFSLIAAMTGLTGKSDFRKVIQYAKKIAGLLGEQKDRPGKYVLNDKGVWFYLQTEDDREANEWICSYLDVVAQTRNLQGYGWGRLLKLRDNEGKEKTWPMPMEMLAGEGGDLRKKLLCLGLQMQPTKRARQHLMSYLASKHPDVFCRSVEKLGWVDEVFIMPQKIYAANDLCQNHVVLAEPENFAKICSSGSLEEWQESIGKYCKGNPLIQLAVAVGLAPILLNLVGHDNFGLHLVGTSSIGKTITLDIAGSIWGGNGARGFKNRWRSTINGLEALAARHNDCLLVLDELGEVSPKAASAAAYMLANGSGKVRGVKEGGLGKQIEWRTIFLSAGEVDLTTHLDSEGHKVHAGQQVRMINLAADRRKGFGCFEDLHGFESSSQFADFLRVGSHKYFGSVAPYFISQIIQDPSSRSKVEFFKSQFKDSLSEFSSHGKILRVLDHFALLYASGCLAVQMGLISVLESELSQSFSSLFREWISSTGKELQEEQMIVDQIVGYLQAYGASRFSDLNSRHPISDHHMCSGYRKKTPTGEIEWLILSEVFKKEICKGFNFKSVTHTLLEKGLLLASQGNNLSSNIRVSHLGQARVYRISGKIMGNTFPVTEMLQNHKS